LQIKEKRNGIEKTNIIEIKPPTKLIAEEHGTAASPKGVMRYKLVERPKLCEMLDTGICIGYVAIREPKPEDDIPLGNNQTFKASFDFGTSSTVLYKSNDRNGLEPFNAKNLWSLPIINIRFGESDRGKFEQYFMPSFADKQYVPFQTLIADSLHEQDNVARLMLMNSWIYFRNCNKSDKVNPLGDGLEPRYNLKWTHQQGAEQKCGEAFIRQCATIIALEARCDRKNSAEVVVTYPLSIEDSYNYMQGIKKILCEVCAENGVYVDEQSAAIINPQDNATASQRIHFLSESVAAYNYAQSKDHAVMHCVIDIGGGSSDIFLRIKQDDNLQKGIAASIPVGAREMLLEILNNKSANKKRTIEDLMFKCPISNVNPGFNAEEIRTETEKFAKTLKSSNDIENLLSMRVDGENSSAGKKYMEYVGSQDGRIQNAQGWFFLPLKCRLALYVGSLAYYSGMLLRDEDLGGYSEIVVTFTGNGSNVLHWIHHNPLNIQNFVRTMFLAGMGDVAKDKIIRCKYSDERDKKHEVAIGALTILDANEAYNETATQKAIVKENSKCDIAGTPIRDGKDDALNMVKVFANFISNDGTDQNGNQGFSWQGIKTLFDGETLLRQDLVKEQINNPDRNSCVVSTVKGIANYYLKKPDKFVRQ